MSDEIGDGRAERLQAQRARILSSAFDLFSQYGSDDTTMLQVAEAAGVSRATVFNHFRSKRALVGGVTEQALGRYEELLDRSLAEQDTPLPDLIRVFFHTVGRVIEANQPFYRGVFREIAKLALGFDQDDPAQQMRLEGLRKLEALLARGQQREEISASYRPAHLASAVDCLIFGTITHWLYGDTSESLPERMSQAAEIFLSSVEQKRVARPSAVDGRTSVAAR